MSLDANVRHTLEIGGHTYPDTGSRRTYSASGGIDIAENIAVGTDTLVNLAIDVSEVEAISIWSDRAIQIETNATDHAGGNILTLIAGLPYVWTSDDYNTFKLTADVTKLYITNASGATARLEIHGCQDATP